MDEIKRLYVGKISVEEVTAINLTNGAVIKTIKIGNETDAEAARTINIDGVAFPYTIAANNTLTIQESIVCNILKLQASATLSVHISGIQLGGA